MNHRKKKEKPIRKNPYREYLENMDVPNTTVPNVMPVSEQVGSQPPVTDVSMQRTLILPDETEKRYEQILQQGNISQQSSVPTGYEAAVEENLQPASEPEDTIIPQAITNSYENMTQDYFDQPTQNMFIDEEEQPVRVGKSSVIGKRQYQQDSVVIPPDDKLLFSGKRKFICALSDGMGGLSGGELASTIATKTLVEDYYKNIWNSDYQKYADFFRNESYKINDEILELKDSDGNPMRSGATLISCIVDDDNLYVLNIGDSRIYLARDNQFHQLTHDQNYYSRLLKMVQNGEISLADADSHPKKEALISYCGIKELTLIETNPQPIKLYKGDVIVMCSDGLYRLLDEQEILQLLQDGDDMNYLAYQLTNAANKKEFRGQDNTSVITIKIF